MIHYFTHNSKPLSHNSGSDATQHPYTKQKIKHSNKYTGRDFPHPSRLALGPTQPPVQWVTCVFLGVEWPRCTAEHPPLSNTEVKYTVDLYYTFNACCSVNFTFTFIIKSASTHQTTNWTLQRPQLSFHIQPHCSTVSNTPRADFV